MTKEIDYLGDEIEVYRIQGKTIKLEPGINVVSDREFDFIAKAIPQMVKILPQYLESEANLDVSTEPSVQSPEKGDSSISTTRKAKKTK